jgi:hypothetical protein
MPDDRSTRQVHPVEPAGKGPQRHPRQPGAAAKVEHRSPGRRYRRLQHIVQQGRHTVIQNPAKLVVEMRGNAVEIPRNIGVGCPRWRGRRTQGREHVRRFGVARIERHKPPVPSCRPGPPALLMQRSRHAPRSLGQSGIEGRRLSVTGQRRPAAAMEQRRVPCGAAILRFHLAEAQALGRRRLPAPQPIGGRGAPG